MTLARALQVAAGNSQESADIAEAIDYDGTNDYLRRASGWGAVNGKSFTVSFWAWKDTAADTDAFDIYNTSTANYILRIQSHTHIRAVNSDSTIILNGSYNLVPPIKTWYHVLISVDLTSTSKRYVYINDVLQSPVWETYTNDTIYFTGGASTLTVAANGDNSEKLKGRMASVFFDYTYRDLSITANRRLFVTADLKPAADQAALNPILYLPMDDPTAPGVNAGTGGNFTLTGTVARSGRGPNQYNAPYSDLDGSADYLSRTTAPTGIADGKQLTFSYVVQPDTTGEKYVFSIATSTTNRFYIAGNGSAMQIAAWNSAGTMVLLAEATLAYTVGRNSVITVSIDLADTAKRHMYVNGLTAASPVWAIYTNDNIQFNVTATPNYRIGSDASTTRLNGRLGALWFNTSYIDLSVADNLAKFVTGTGIDAKPVDLGASGELPTGTSPLIYLPMYGNNAGKNYGTGGDFTVNSGPYTGARGPNEFWGNLAYIQSGGLDKTPSLSGVTAGTAASMSFFLNMPSFASPNYYILQIRTATYTNLAYLYFSASNTLNIYFTSSTGVVLVNATVTYTFPTNTNISLQFSFDTTDTNKRKLYIDGVDRSGNMTWNTYTSGTLGVGIGEVYIGKSFNGISLQGKLSEFYFTTDYIDFSQEANRLKFRDAFGNPVNLTQQIEDAAIPNPAIYMRFDPASFGTNYGTGGNFTVNGTITDGGQL